MDKFSKQLMIERGKEKTGSGGNDPKTPVIVEFTQLYISTLQVVCENKENNTIGAGKKHEDYFI